MQSNGMDVPLLCMVAGLDLFSTDSSKLCIMQLVEAVITQSQLTRDDSNIHLYAFKLNT